MAWVLATILGLMWTLAMISPYANDGFVHIFLAAAVVTAAYKILRNHYDNKFKKGV